MDKTLIATEIAHLENQVLSYEQVVAKNQKLIQSTNFNYYSGQVAVIVGLLGIILLSNLWGIWLFLLAIGVLTYFSARSKRSAATTETEQLQNKILELKRQANDLRSQLLIP